MWWKMEVGAKREVGRVNIPSLIHYMCKVMLKLIWIRDQLGEPSLELDIYGKCKCIVGRWF